MAATLQSLVTSLDQVLDTRGFQDTSLNGLQVDGGRAQVATVAVAVDSGLSVLRAATEKGADLLIVHHGLFWGQAQPLTGVFGEKIRQLLTKGCSLYASHLPLDGHSELGNAVQLGQSIGLTGIEPFGLYGQRTIGCRGQFSEPAAIETIADRMKEFPGALTQPLVIPAGKTTIRSVAVVTGSGCSLIDQAAAAGVDLFLSGEPKHGAYHDLKEAKLSAVFAGHYCTETFGVRALATFLKERFRVETIFIDEPSGI
jgi:dinuclear metal center YbgI/SA1388 family protein